MTTLVARDRPIPLYHQIELALRARIEKGEWAAGTRIPPELTLAGEYGVSRVTVRQALDRLAAQGYVSRRQGRGTFVCRPKILLGNQLLGFTEEMRLLGLYPASRTIEQRAVPAGREVAQALDIAPGTPVVRLVRVRLVDGRPMALNIVSLPAALCPGLVDENLERDSLYRLLETKYRVVLDRAEKTIEAMAAPARVARLLEISRGAPVFHVRKRTFNHLGMPVEYQEAFWRGDRYTFRVTEVRQRPVAPVYPERNEESWTGQIPRAGGGDGRSR